MKARSLLAVAVVALLACTRSHAPGGAAASPSPSPSPADPRAADLGTLTRYPKLTDPWVASVVTMYGDHPLDCVRALEPHLTGTIRLSRDASDSPAVIAIGDLPRDVVETCAVEIPESTDVPASVQHDPDVPALTALVVGGGPDPTFWIGFAPSGRFVVHRDRARVLALLPMVDKVN